MSSLPLTRTRPPANDSAMGLSTCGIQVRLMGGKFSVKRVKVAVHMPMSSARPNSSRVVRKSLMPFEVSLASRDTASSTRSAGGMGWRRLMDTSTALCTMVPLALAVDHSNGPMPSTKYFSQEWTSPRPRLLRVKRVS